LICGISAQREAVGCVYDFVNYIFISFIWGTEHSLLYMYLYHTCLYIVILCFTEIDVQQQNLFLTLSIHEVTSLSFHLAKQIRLSGTF